MKCEILNLGTELLLGQIVNTNAAYIAERLADHGIECYHQEVVGDNLVRAVAAIKQALKRSDAIVITGGLGSTEDDITRAAISEATKRPLTMRASLKRVVEERLTLSGTPVNETTLRQAMLPRGAEAVLPTKGTAPGIILAKDDSTVVALPGVPSEMKSMLESSVLPYLVNRYGTAERPIISRTLKVYGLREPEVAERLRPMISSQENPTIALLVGLGDVIVRLTASAGSATEAVDLLDGTEQAVRSELGFYVYATDDATMEEAVGNLLLAQGFTVGCAESVTGGLVAAQLVNVAGASVYFAGGVIAYKNALKLQLLDVSAQSLLAHGAVSAVVAEEMANGVRRRLGVDIGISSTGIAGPTGGTPEKPVGLVHFGLAARDALLADHLVFQGDRNEIRAESALHLMNILRLYLLDRALGGSETA